LLVLSAQSHTVDPMSKQRSILAPSILAADHADLASGVARIDALALEWVHIDIMDGHFVPNYSFGPETVRALRSRTKLFFDVHLMLDNPHDYVEPFARAGADLISIHVEPAYDIAGTLARIRESGCKTGVVLNPATPVEAVLPFLPMVDLVLVMTVQPGFGGQSFRDEMLPKIHDLDTVRRERALGFRLEVDGGIDLGTAARCAAAGADTFVCGTSFFRAKNQAEFAAAITAL
jgi:ribulose-phosphate 3-epimerase